MSEPAKQTLRVGKPRRCSQCGESYLKPGCGPTHAMIRAEIIARKKGNAK